MNEFNLLITKPSSGYELIDSGEGEKLERFGDVVLSRPDPQALWHRRLSDEEWSKSNAHFTRSEVSGDWKIKKGVPEKWQINFSSLTFNIKPTAFKHTGIFPEQSVNWDWIRDLIKDKKDIDVLNLFGYTGGATLACAQAGAKVVHVDSSKSAITWARENAESSGLSEKPIRWILEDVRIFVSREIKRGNKYDAIIMDPPAFGHGTNNEIWKIEEHFIQLIDDCFKLLKDKPLFFLVNGYSSGYSAIAYKNSLNYLIEKYGGSIEMGELAIEEKDSKRLLPCGIFARWR
jgi:23S rRNA (cytosine1962-C5)-methyltransferase